MQSSQPGHADLPEQPMLNSRINAAVEPLLIDRQLFEVWFAGTKIELTATEYDVLALLHSEHNRVLSRDEILEGVWGGPDRSSRVVDTYVSRVRTKLRLAGHPGVHSVRKRGYRLAGPVGPVGPIGPASTAIEDLSPGSPERDLE